MLREKNKSKKRLTINAIQNGIFYMLFILLPFAVIPLPWDWAERGISILILIVSTIIVALELLKFIWEGKFSIFKNGIDTGIFLVLLASTISTIFSVDTGMSFWGVDMNLGSGLISLIAVILVSFTMRSFIDSFEEIVKVLMYFSVGVSIINIFSLLSFFNVDFLGILPAYKEVFTYGLPWTLSSSTLLVLNSVLILISSALLIWNKNKNKGEYILSIAVLIISLITTILFSVNQNLPIILILILFMSVLIFLTWRILRFKKSEEKSVRIATMIPLTILVISFVLMKIPSIKESIVGSLNLLTQVTLGGDISWEVVSSGMSSNFFRSIIGFGKNSFVILYNMFKPGTTEVLSFNNTSFYNGSSEFLTQLGEGGIIWLGAWIYLGYVMIKEFFSQIKSLKRTGSNEQTVFTSVLSLSSIFIYVTSFFCDWSIVIYLVFFLLISLWIVCSNVGKIKLPDKFVLKMWAVDTNSEKFRNISGSIQKVNISATVVLAVITVWITGVWGKMLVSNIYISSAEAYISEKSVEFEDKNPSYEEKEAFLTEVLDVYSKAEKYEKNNSLINRKLALLNLEKVSLYAEEYTFSDSENEKEELLDKVAIYKREVVNQVQKSVYRNPEIYDNWKTAGSAYMGLLSIGFDDYDRDALAALSKSADLNPTNYELYYNAAQIYLIQEDIDNSLTMLVKVLEINPRHIPSLLMAGEINKELGKNDVYLSYLKAAKAIMEEYDQTETETYQEVVRDIRQEEETGES